MRLNWKLFLCKFIIFTRSTYNHHWIRNKLHFASNQDSIIRPTMVDFVLSVCAWKPYHTFPHSNTLYLYSLLVELIILSNFQFSTSRWSRRRGLAEYRSGERECLRLVCRLFSFPTNERTQGRCPTSRASSVARASGVRLLEYSCTAQQIFGTGRRLHEQYKIWRTLSATAFYVYARIHVCMRGVQNVLDRCQEYWTPIFHHTRWTKLEMLTNICFPSYSRSRLKLPTHLRSKRWRRSF